MTDKKEDLSILLQGDNIISVDLEEFVNAMFRDKRYLEMKLRFRDSEYLKFKDYVDDPTISVECYYDQDTKTYFYGVKPREGEEYQKALNKKLGIK